MVQHSIRRARAARHVDDGDLVLERSRAVVTTLNLADISGNTWTRQRLERLANALQAQMDTKIPISSLAPDDFDRLMSEAPDADAQFLAAYGNSVFLDGAGNMVHRPDTISFSLVDGDLSPTITAVGGTENLP